MSNIFPAFRLPPSSPRNPALCPLLSSTQCPIFDLSIQWPLSPSLLLFSLLPACSCDVILFMIVQVCYCRLLRCTTTSRLSGGNEYFRYPPTSPPPIITCSMIHVSFPHITPPPIPAANTTLWSIQAPTLPQQFRPAGQTQGYFCHTCINHWLTSSSL